MSDLRDLYQDVILDHYRKPRNFSQLADANREAVGHNPLCGDRVAVYLHVEDGVIQDVSFQGSGCAISTASASLMTEAIKGKSLEEVENLYQSFHRVVTGGDGEGEGTSAPGCEHDDSELGKLEVLSGVREYPVRIKCATLAWHALRSAIESHRGSATTE